MNTRAAIKGVSDYYVLKLPSGRNLTTLGVRDTDYCITLEMNFSEYGAFKTKTEVQAPRLHSSGHLWEGSTGTNPLVRGFEGDLGGSVSTPLHVFFWEDETSGSLE